MSFNTFWNGNRGRGYGPRNPPRGWRGSSSGHVPSSYDISPSTPFYGGSRRGFTQRGGRGNINQMFQSYVSPSNKESWPSYRNQRQFFQDDSSFDISQFSQDKPFLSPPRCRTPQRTLSPLPGSEEYMQRDISEKSALLKRELELEGSSSDINLSNNPSLNSDSELSITNTFLDNANKCSVQEESITARKTKKLYKPVQTPPTTLTVDEIHDKIINHISNLSYNKKFNIVNQAGPSGYDFAIHQITRQKRLELSRALRDMCNNKFKESEESSAVINSIIPDFDIKIETLPREFVQQLSSTLFEEGEYSCSSIDPETLFQQAADMLTSCDTFDAAPQNSALEEVIQEDVQENSVANETRLVPELQSTLENLPASNFGSLQHTESSSQLPFCNLPMLQNFPLFQPPLLPSYPTNWFAPQIPSIYPNVSLIQKNTTDVILPMTAAPTDIPVSSKETANCEQVVQMPLDVPAENIPLPATSSECKIIKEDDDKPITLSNAIPPQPTSSENSIADTVESTGSEVNNQKKVNFTIESPKIDSLESSIEEKTQESVETENTNDKIRSTSNASELERSELIKDKNNSDIKNSSNKKKVEKHLENFDEDQLKTTTPKIDSDHLAKTNNTLEDKTKDKCKKVKHKTRHTQKEFESNKVDIQHLSYTSSDSKKSKETHKIFAKKKLPEYSDTHKVPRKHLDESKSDTLSKDRSRSLSTEIDKVDKRHDKILEEKSHSRSRSNEKDILHRTKYDERHNRHRSERSRYDRFEAEKYDEAYREYHQAEEDRHRQSYDKYRERVYSSESEHPPELVWYAKYGDRDEMRHSKRYHYDKSAYMQRNKYEDGQDYEYYRHDIPITPEEYEQQIHSHYHRNKHSKSHKRSGKKHKKHKEVSPSSNSMSSHSDADASNSRSSRQKSPENVLEERNIIKHKKTLKERLQVMNELKGIDKREELYERPEYENYKIKEEPISPIQNKSREEVNFELVQEHEVTKQNVELSESDGISSRSPLMVVVDSAKPHFESRNLQVLEQDGQEICVNDLSSAKSFPDDNLQDLPEKNNELLNVFKDPPDIFDIIIESTVLPVPHNKLEEPKKAIQRPWKSPGEKKFMMEQLNNEQQSVSNNDLQSEESELSVEPQIFIESNVIVAISEQGSISETTTGINQTETDDANMTEILHSAEVSSTSDTSGKNTKAEPAEIILKTSAVTITLPKRQPLENPMLVTTYTQTITPAPEELPKKEEKKTFNRRKHRMYNIGIQACVTRYVSSTQTPVIKCRTAQVQVDIGKKSAVKSISVQTDRVVIQNDEKASRNILKPKRRQNVIRRMLDLDSEIQKLTLLRQNLYKELECGMSSEEEYEEKPDMQKQTAKIPNTSNKLSKIESQEHDNIQKSDQVEKLILLPVETKRNSRRGRGGKTKQADCRKQQYNRAKSPEHLETDTNELTNFNKAEFDIKSDISEPVIIKLPTKASLKELTTSEPINSLQDVASKKLKGCNTLPIPVLYKKGTSLTPPPEETKSITSKQVKTKATRGKRKRLESETFSNDEKAFTPNRQNVPEVPKRRGRQSKKQLEVETISEDEKIDQHSKRFKAVILSDEDEKDSIPLSTLANSNSSVELECDTKELELLIEPLHNLVKDEVIIEEYLDIKHSPKSIENLQPDSPNPSEFRSNTPSNRSENPSDPPQDISEMAPEPQQLILEIVHETSHQISEIAAEPPEQITEMALEPSQKIPEIVSDPLPSDNSETDLKSAENIIKTSLEPLNMSAINEISEVSLSELPIQNNGNSDSDIPLKTVKQLKRKKKRKSGPLSRIQKRRKFFQTNQAVTTPSQVGIVKIARYSIYQLEEMRNSIRSPFKSANNEGVESGEEHPRSKTVLCESGEPIFNEEVNQPSDILEPLPDAQTTIPVENTAEDVNNETVLKDTAVEKNETTSDFAVTFKGFTGAILAIKVIKETVLAATDHGQLLLFNMITGDIIHTFNISKVAITSMLVIRRNDNDYIYVGSLNTILTILNVDNNEVYKEEKIDEPIQCMENSWDYIFIGSDRGSLIRYDLHSEKVEDVIKIADTNVLMIKATNEGPRKVLLIATRNATVSVRDACSGLLLRSLQAPFVPTVYTLLFDRNFVYCGTSQHDILVYTFEDGQLVFKHEATKSKGVVCMQIAGNLLFAGCYNGNVYIYNTKTNTHLGTMTGPGGLMLSMEIVSNKIIIVGTKSSNFKAWQIPQQYLEEM